METPQSPRCGDWITYAAEMQRQTQPDGQEKSDQQPNG